MDLLPTLLPLLGPDRAGGLVLPAAVAYLPAGALYLALTGIDATVPLPLRRSLAAAAAAIGLWTAALLAWPLVLAARSLRSLHRRTPAAAPCRLRAVPPVAAVPAQYAPPAPVPLPTRPATPPTPPDWYLREYEAVGVALAEGRIAIARIWAGFLADDAAVEFGPAHPYTQEAWLLVARTVNTALAEIHAAGPVTASRPIGDPHQHFLFPNAYRAGAWDPDRDSVYTAIGHGHLVVTR